MTEADWRAATDAEPMLWFLYRQDWRRARGPRLDFVRFRTFAAACVNRLRPLLSDTLCAVVDELAYIPPRGRRKELDRLREVYDAEYAALEATVRRQIMSAGRREEAELRVRQSAAQMVGFAARPDPYQAALRVAGSAVYTVWWMEELGARPADEPITHTGADPLPQRKVQADLARCVFGNPFRPVAFEPAWRTEAVVALARGMDEACDFAALPVLADALEDAEYADAELLAHCRGAGPHARGCHAVDHVLGRW